MFRVAAVLVNKFCPVDLSQQTYSKTKVTQFMQYINKEKKRKREREFYLPSKDN